MSQQSYVIEANATAPPEVVFALLADGAGWKAWAGPFIQESSWERTGDPPGGVGAIRRLGWRRFASREEIVAYDPPRHLAYTMLSGQPVRNYRADVELTAHDGGTHIRWSATFTPLLPGTGPLLRVYLRAIVGGFARRLATPAGTPHSHRPRLHQP